MKLLRVAVLSVECVWFSYSYGGYASGDSPQVGAQPVYSVNVQQVVIVHSRYSFIVRYFIPANS